MNILSTTKKLGMAAAVAFSLAAPLMAAAPASAEPYHTMQIIRYGHDTHVRVDQRRDDRYRDMHWKQTRFEHRHEHGRFER